MADHAHNLRARSWSQDGPVGVPTRGTTGFNRLRKTDRWLASQPQLSSVFHSAILSGRQPLAVDVGYGASHTTTVEWAHWLRKVNPHVRVVGLEIEPDRVLPPRDGVEFQLGGFELAGMRADVIRAFNVLRQYDVAEVIDAWQLMASRLRPGGVLMEGTCDEIGRRSTWIIVDHSGPKHLTMAWDPEDMAWPSEIAERLPKALIHENTPGHRIHDVLQLMDDAWAKAAGYAPFGPRVRWRWARADFLAELPGELGVVARKLNPRRRLQDNSLTVPWPLVSDLQM